MGCHFYEILWNIVNEKHNFEYRLKTSGLSRAEKNFLMDCNLTWDGPFPDAVSPAAPRLHSREPLPCTLS